MQIRRSASFLQTWLQTAPASHAKTLSCERAAGWIRSRRPHGCRTQADNFLNMKMTATVVKDIKVETENVLRSANFRFPTVWHCWKQQVCRTRCRLRLRKPRLQCLSLPEASHPQVLCIARARVQGELGRRFPKDIIGGVPTFGACAQAVQKLVLLSPSPVQCSCGLGALYLLGVRARQSRDHVALICFFGRPKTVCAGGNRSSTQTV